MVQLAQLILFVQFLTAKTVALLTGGPCIRKFISTLKYCPFPLFSVKLATIFPASIVILDWLWEWTTSLARNWPGLISRCGADIGYRSGPLLGYGFLGHWKNQIFTPSFWNKVMSLPRIIASLQNDHTQLGQYNIDNFPAWFREPIVKPEGFKVQ